MMKNLPTTPARRNSPPNEGSQQCLKLKQSCSEKVILKNLNRMFVFARQPLLKATDKRVTLPGVPKTLPEPPNSKRQSAHRRAQTAERKQYSEDRRKQTAERRPQSAESTPQSEDSRAETEDRRPQTAERRPQSADLRAQTAQRMARLPVVIERRSEGHTLGKLNPKTKGTGWTGVGHYASRTHYTTSTL